MKILMSLLGLVTLLATAGCYVEEGHRYRGGYYGGFYGEYPERHYYRDGYYYHGYYHGPYDRDHYWYRD